MSLHPAFRSNVGRLGCQLAGKPSADAQTWEMAPENGKASHSCEYPRVRNLFFETRSQRSFRLPSFFCAPSEIQLPMFMISQGVWILTAA